MKTILILALIVLGLSCEQKSVEPDCVATPNANCLCTLQYDPVCGCDGKTYGNACEAACQGIRVVAKGACTNN